MRSPLIALLVLTLTSAACSSETPSADSQATTIASTSDSTGENAEATSSGSTTSLADLQKVLDLTVALPRMSFEMDVTSSFPDSTATVVANQTGSFDDNTLTGVGTRRFITEDEAISELLGVDAFEFRFINQVIWIYNPLDDPPQWSGFRAFEFAELSGADPSRSMDSDSFLTLLVAATIEVVDVKPEDDGTNTWTLRVRADDLLPIVATGGPAARMAEAGAGESGLKAEVALTQSAGGHFIGFSAELDEWWTNAVSLVPDGGTDNQHMTVEFRAETFPNPLAPQVPCANPASTTENGLAVVSCPG